MLERLLLAAYNNAKLLLVSYNETMITMVGSQNIYQAHSTSLITCNCLKD